MPKMLMHFSEQALGDLLRFIRFYEEAFFELYRDSGVWNEDLIIQSYCESAQKLYLTILQEIESRLTPRKVLGRKELRNNHYEIYVHVGSRLVIVSYSDHVRQPFRLVESIAIDRKPIIF